MNSLTDKTTYITPSEREYVTTIACPEAITNALHFISARLEDTEDPAEDHTNIRIEYPLDYVCPSSRSLLIIDKNLERRGVNWRIHSAHTMVVKEVCRLVIRKVSLIDLTTPDISITPVESELERIMTTYSRQYKQPTIVGPSNITAFKLPDKSDGSAGGFYWVYTRVFDMWEYNDQFPHVGWKEIL